MNKIQEFQMILNDMLLTASMKEAEWRKEDNLQWVLYWKNKKHCIFDILRKYKECFNLEPLLNVKDLKEQLKQEKEK